MPAQYHTAKRFSSFLGLAGVAISLTVLPAPRADAANSTWSGNGGTPDWSNSGNWNNGIPTSVDTAFFQTLTPADTPVTVNLDSPQSISIFNFNNTDGRSYVFEGSAITFASASNTSRILTGNSPVASVTFNNDVVFGNGTSTFTVGGTQDSTSNFSTVTFNGGLIATTDAGLKTLAIRSIGNTVINGSNTAGFVSWAAGGEITVGSTSALGAGSLQRTGTSSGTLSFRSDATVGGGSYSWTQSASTVYLRLSELSASSADRTFTLTSRLIGVAGSAFEWAPNVNSTGNLILELQYTGGNSQDVALITNSTGIVRFANTGTSTSYTGVISGAGRVEKTNTGTITINGANTYTGGTTISEGTLKLGATGSLATTGAVLVNGGQFDLNGKAQTVGAVTLTSGTIANGTLTGSGYAVEAGAISAALAGSGSLTKSAAGSVTLSASNSYTGATTVSNGTLLLSGSGSIAQSSGLDVAAGATFSISGISGASYTFGAGQTISGAGTIAAGGKQLILNGSLSPGNSAGTLTFDPGAGGSLTLGANSTFTFELGTASDLAVLNSGSLNIGSDTLDFEDFTFVVTDGFGAGTYTLFQTTSAIAGTLGLNTGTIGGYDGTLAIDGNNLILTVIPEPKTWALLLTCAAGVMVRCATGRNKR